MSMDYIKKLPKKPSGFDFIQVVVYRLTKSTHFSQIKATGEMEMLIRTYAEELVRLHVAPR